MKILQELDDHGIIEKIFIDFDQNSVKPALLANNSDDYRILQEMYDHRILVKIFPVFDYNSSWNRWPWKYCENFHWIQSEFC